MIKTNTTRRMVIAVLFVSLCTLLTVGCQSDAPATTGTAIGTGDGNPALSPAQKARRAQRDKGQ